MKDSNIIRYLAIFVFTLACILAACAEKTPEPLEPSAQVMLEVEDCGWQEPDDAPGFHEGLLIISESQDDYSERHEFTGIRTPEIREETTAFGGKALFLQRYDTLWGPGCPGGIFVSEKEDFRYLTEMLAGLTFSSELSPRSNLEAGVLLTTFDLAGDEWEETCNYYLCSDGVVLKEAGVDPITNYAVQYESWETVDYYRVSAMEVKYNLFSGHQFYPECHDKHEPEAYRLCISSRNGHRDFSWKRPRPCCQNPSL